MNILPHDMKTAILEKASVLFQEKGYSGVSISDITEALGISKPTLYYHFGNKETLFYEVMKGYLQKKRDALNAPELNLFKCPPTSPPSLEKSLEITLSNLCHTYCQESPTCLSSFIRENLLHLSPDTSTQLLETYRLCIIQPFADIFQAYIAQASIVQEKLTLKIINKNVSQTMGAEDLAILSISMLDSLLFKSHFFKSSGQNEPQIPPNAKELPQLTPPKITACPKIEGIVQILLHGI